MRHEFFPSNPDRRFQKRADFATAVTHRNADQMSPDSATNTDEPVAPAEEGVRPRASDYLWRPWYAKLWWAAIPIYWAGMAASLKVPPLQDFYASALAGYFNVLFFPMTALMVLGVGYARVVLDRLAEESVPGEPSDHDFGPGRRVGAPPPGFDPLDPRSGALWIGNPSNILRQYPRH
ncbi:hypothetical protein [Sphingobium terrigena]|nr:hypothetical protein [Sphingobium terrigena]